MKNTTGAKTFYRSCNICEAMCGIVVKTRGDEILSIAGDKDDPFSKGHVCAKATALKELHSDPDRLRHPVRRNGKNFERVSWKEALDETGRRICAAQKRHGRNSVGVYVGNPTAHLPGALLMGLPFIDSLRTRNRFSASSTDQLPLMMACWYLFGHQFMFPVPDLDRTDFFLVLGGNPAVSNGSIMTAPGMGKRIEGIRQRGGRVAVVDPMRTKTAELADQHLFIRPGTDVLFLLSFIHTLFAENLVRPGRLAAFTDGIERLAECAADFSPVKTAPFTGIDAEDTVQLARDFASAPSAVAYGRLGTCTQEFGVTTTWLIIALNILTGNLDRIGGAMFTRPAVDMVKLTALVNETGHHGLWKSRVKGLPEFSGEAPVSTLADEILTPGPGQIRAFFTIAGNPVLSAPNGKLIDKALEKLDFMASFDTHINETTRHADIILPPASLFAHDHFDFVFQSFSVRNNVKYSPAIFPPEPDLLPNWRIFRELILRVEKNPAKRLAFSLAEPERILRFLVRFGHHGKGLSPFKKGLSLDEIKKYPHGLDLGPLTPALPERLYTADRRINLAPPVFVKDIDRARSLTEFKLAELSSFDMLLIGRRNLASNNSWFHNTERLHKGSNRCTAIINPEDARRLRIKSGDRVRVSSRVGAVELEAEVSSKVMPKVVSIPHGWGHHRKGSQMKVACAHAGVSANDITDNEVMDPVSGNAVYNGVPVRVEKI